MLADLERSEVNKVVVDVIGVLASQTPHSESRFGTLKPTVKVIDHVKLVPYDRKTLLGDLESIVLWGVDLGTHDTILEEVQGEVQLWREVAWLTAVHGKLGLDGAILGHDRVRIYRV